MKAAFLSALALFLAFTARAQTGGETYSPEQLDQLLGPIALYPDPLIAIILPASAAPSDLVAAASYVAANGDPAQIDGQPWDPSVKALTRYPSVLKWMTDNLSWTQALGAAFAIQPADVMKSIQQLRVQARAAGTLVDTPQQHIDIEGDDIRIIPTQPDTIYVPAYDPSIVYETPDGDYGPFLTFGIGYPAGPWLGFECDWDDFGIWIGPWAPGWAYRRDWRNRGPGGAWHAWHPDPARSRELVRNFYRPGNGLPSPRVSPEYHGPNRAPNTASHVNISRAPSAPSRPDYRGRAPETARPSSPAPSGNFFGGSYGRGAQTRDFSNRGQTSRAVPVRPMPASRGAPSRGAPSSGGGGGREPR